MTEQPIQSVPDVQPTTADTDQSEKVERDRLLRQAYTAATTTIRKNHQDEFETLYAEEAAARGVEWSPRKTARQKAEEQFHALLEQFPHLAEQVDGDDDEPATTFPV